MHGPLTRYAKLRVAHAPGMPRTFSPPSTSGEPLASDPGMHHGTCVTHVSWCMSGSLTRGGGENVPLVPGVCATRTFTYLIRGPCARDAVCGEVMHLWGVNIWFSGKFRIATILSFQQIWHHNAWQNGVDKCKGISNINIYVYMYVCWCCVYTLALGDLKRN